MNQEYVTPLEEISTFAVKHIFKLSSYTSLIHKKTETVKQMFCTAKL